MQTVRLGRTGLSVSKLCFGTMTFGGDADAGQSAQLYARCRDAGINFFDCADVYNGGATEEILGRLIAHERNEIILTSKCGMKSKIGDGLSRWNIMHAVEGSLKRLGTDRLDILFAHRFDESVPLEHTLRAFDDLVSDGKVLYLGVSNFAAWQIAKALGLQTHNGWARFDVIQPMYNLVKRQAEVEILPLAISEDMAVMPYGPNGGGLLTGKYHGGAKPEGTRLTANDGYTKRYAVDWYHETASAFVDLAQTMGVHPVTLAVSWVAHHPGITLPIVGARSVEQLEPSLAAAEFNMTDDLWHQIADLSRTPSPATDRLEQQG